jgi:hypothetical protein
MNRKELIDLILDRFSSDLQTSLAPFNEEEKTEVLGTLVEFLKGVYDKRDVIPAYNFEGGFFNEIEFIEKRLMTKYPGKMVPFIKTSLHLYFSKDEFKQTLLFKKLQVNEELLDEEEYSDYILKLYVSLQKLRNNYSTAK